MSEQTREEAIEYIHSVSWRGSQLGLGRMEKLLALLGSPEQKLRYVHVAGTNGKGSVCAMTASVLTRAGYKTGLYTSPYVSAFNERIQVDGTPIADGELIAVTADIRRFADSMADDPPTEFELVTAIAFEYFARQRCDIVVLEVGLGGRLDATNIIPPPLVAVITTLSLDHTAELGGTLDKIAAEKGGILKRGSRAVLYPQRPEAQAVLLKICEQLELPVTSPDPAAVTLHSQTLEGQRFDYKAYKDLRLGLLGLYQPANAALVVEVVESLRAAGLGIPDAALYDGLAAAALPARFERLRSAPDVIVDGGHNIQAVEALREALGHYYPGKQVLFITGVMADKDYSAMYPLILPLARGFYTVTPDNPRALAAERLAGELRAQGARAESCTSVDEALERALAVAGEEDMLCIFGSFYMAGEVRRFFGR